MFAWVDRASCAPFPEEARFFFDATGAAAVRPRLDAERLFALDAVP
jgi:hypothetical protein